MMIGFNYHEGKRWDNTIMGDACVTKFSDEGDEISGVVIPKSQRVMNTLYPDELVLRRTNKYLFRDDRTQSDNNQYPSFESLSNRNCNYLFFNDYVSNDGKSFRDKRTAVSSFENAEAVCYKIDGNDETQRQYLFSKPAPDESRALLIESMDLHADEKRFAALVSVRKGKERHLHVAWCSLN